MTAHPAACTATPAAALQPALWSRPDPVRSRVHFAPQLTHFEMLRADAARRSPAGNVRFGELPNYLPPDTGTPRPRRPHPGDIVYWLTCLGGICLLLFAGTR